MSSSTISVQSTGTIPVGAENIGGAGTEYRERIQMGGTGAAELVDVKNTDPTSSMYGNVVRPVFRKIVTYDAVVRLAARPYALSNAFGAAGRKQFATIHHAATATKLVKLRHAFVYLESSSAAGIIMLELIRITSAPATGNPAITPLPRLASDAAAEVTVLGLPTTAATETGTPVGQLEYNLGITGAASTGNPPPPLQPIDLLSPASGYAPDFDIRLPSIRAGTLEGYAVTADASAAITVKGYVHFTFTEE